MSEGVDRAQEMEGKDRERVVESEIGEYEVSESPNRDNEGKLR